MHNIRPASHIRPTTSHHVARNAQQESDYFYDTNIKSTVAHISFTAFDYLNHKVHGVNQLGYCLVSHVSEFKTKPMFVLTVSRSIKFYSLHIK